MTYDPLGYDPLYASKVKLDPVPKPPKIGLEPTLSKVKKVKLDPIPRPTFFKPKVDVTPVLPKTYNSGISPIQKTFYEPTRIESSAPLRRDPGFRDCMTPGAVPGHAMLNGPGGLNPGAGIGPMGPIG
jgi:hypothetical protein